MDKLLSFTPEPFPELDREAEYDEIDPLAGEWEAEEAEEEVRRGRRPRLSAKAPRRSVRKPPVRPRVPSRATGPRVKPLRQLRKLMPRPLPVPALRPVPIPFIPPLWGLRPDLEPAPPRDSQRPEESRRPEQAGSEGSGSPPTAQPAEEPASEHVRWVQDCLNRALGLQLSVDGVMNRETRSALRLLQERRGLPVTGMIGPDTEAALQAACSSVPESRNVSEQQLETEWVHPTFCTCPLCTEAATMNNQLSFEAEPFAGNTELQEFETLELETLDPWQGKSGADSPQKVRWIQESLNKILGLQLKVDGIKGLQTRNAIRNFQHRHGIPVDGIVDPKTEAAITKASGSMPNLTVPPSDMPAYTQCDFTHPNIDVSAQYALYGMLKSDPASRDASVQMLAAVKTGRLGGIYQEDQRVPGMRGVHLGHGWYGPLISTYRRSASSAACIPPAPHPSHKLEIISFKKSLAKDLAELGRQLCLVWSDCTVSKIRFPPVPPRGGACSRASKTKTEPDTPKTIAPGICAYPESLRFFTTEGASSRDVLPSNPQQLTIRNCGEGVVGWKTSIRYRQGSERWLQIDRASGSATYSQPEVVAVSCIQENLPKVPLGANASVTHTAELVFSPIYEGISPSIASVAIPIEVQVTGRAPALTKPPKKVFIDRGVWTAGPLPKFVNNVYCCGTLRFELRNLGPLPAVVHISDNGGGTQGRNIVPGGVVAIDFSGKCKWAFTIMAFAISPRAGGANIQWSLVCMN